MTRNNSLRPAILALLAASTVVLSLGSAQADAGQPGARPQRASTAQQGPRPAQHRPGADRQRDNVVERTTTRSRTDNGWTSNSSWTHRDGGTGNSQTIVVRDAEAGTRSRDTVTTLPNGETRTVNSSGTRTDNGFINNTTINGPQGTTTRQTEMVRTDDGRVVTTDVVRPDGAELSRTVTVTRDAETGEVTRHIERSGPND